MSPPLRSRIHGVFGLLMAMSITMGCSGNGTADSASPSQTPNGDKRRALSESLEPIHERFARVVLDPAAEVNVFGAQFLNAYEIIRVEHSDPPAFTLFYVGFSLGKDALLLTGAPENYTEMARADGAVIGTPDEAVEYVLTYLEVTRSMAELFYVVQNVDEIEFRPNLTDEEERIKKSFLQEYAHLLQPARAEAKNGSHVVTVHAVRDRALERHAVVVGRDGSIQHEITVVQQNLPLVYGL